LINKKFLGILIVILALAGSLSAVEPALPNSQVQGTVIDSSQQVPLEYANIILFNQNGDEQVDGTVTDQSGYFNFRNIPTGQYFVKINYMGYKTDSVAFRIAPEYSEINLGDISLSKIYLEMAGVEATAQNVSIDYQIDKKILNVNRQQSSISGSAVDILENAPSVTTDIEGNVELRGSSSFRVLINGKPTVLDANDVLQQTPASTIEKIEIITNPSAKYNPEGSAGIINLVLKKNRIKGVNGMLNANAGSYDRYGGEVLLNYNKKKFNTTLSLDYNKRPSPGVGWENSWTSQNDTTTYIYSHGDNEWQREHYGFRGSVEYLPDTNNTFKLSLRVGSRSGQRYSDNIFQRWVEVGSSVVSDTTHYDNISEGEFGADFYSLNLNYNHDFHGKGHKVEGNLNLSRRERGSQSIDKQFDNADNITSGTKNVEDGPGNIWEIKLDYTLPLNGNNKFEAGLQDRGAQRDELNENYIYDPQISDFVHQTQFDHDVKYHRNIGAAYSLYSDEWRGFGYQLGLRAEYTYRKIELVGENEQFNIDRWDYFPTLHTSYQLSRQQELMMSYTRRIDRPRGWYLEPFETWSDPYNIRQGNPALTPEYINSFEMGYKRNFDRSFFSLEGYYRNTVDKIERVRSVHPDYDDVFLHSYANVGEDHSLGSEVMLNLNLYQWWNMNLSGNLYNYRVTGNLNGEDFDRESFNWTARFNNTFKLDKKTKVQINYSYNSPSVSSQGTRKGYYRTSASIRRDFMDNKFTAILQARDIFDTAEWEYESEGTDFYMQRHFDRNAPIFSLTLRYNINRYKSKRPDRQNGGDYDSIDSGEF